MHCACLMCMLRALSRSRALAVCMIHTSMCMPPCVLNQVSLPRSANRSSERATTRRYGDCGLLRPINCLTVVRTPTPTPGATQTLQTCTTCPGPPQPQRNEPRVRRAYSLDVPRIAARHATIARMGAGLTNSGTKSRVRGNGCAKPEAPASPIGAPVAEECAILTVTALLARPAM